MIPPALSTLTPPGTGDGVPGKPVRQGVQGNPGVSTVPAQPPPYQPGNQYGGDPPAGHRWAPGVMNPPRTPWRGGADFSLENTAYDRHVLVRNMEPRVGVQPSIPGNPPNPDDPRTPPRPLFSFLNRAINPQVGSDNNANQDDLTRNYARVPNASRSRTVGGSQAIRPTMQRTSDGNAQYAGEQGSGWAPVYGGVPGLYQPYGSYSGYTARDLKGIQSPIEQGQPGDGPHKVFSGPPHGLHSQTYPSYDATLGRYEAIPQQHAPRVDRPANSPIAGQDYSQTVQPQGQSGSVTQSPVRFQSRSRFVGG